MRSRGLEFTWKKRRWHWQGGRHRASQGAGRVKEQEGGVGAQAWPAQVWGPPLGDGGRGVLSTRRGQRGPCHTCAPPRHPQNGHPEGTTGKPTSQSAGLPAHCCLIFNSFTRSKSGPQMHLFKVYSSMALSLFTELCKHHHNLTLGHFYPSKRNPPGASLVAQWLRICLPMQGTQVRALVWEDPTCRGATRPVGHSY